MESPEECRVAALEIAAARAETLAAALDGGVEVETRNGWPAAMVCAHYAMRTSRTLSAAVHLCANSFGVESQSLLRNMSQDMVEVRYIATDPVVLSEQWRVHESRRRYYVYNSRVELQEMDEPEDLNELEQLIESDWNEARDLAAAKLHKEPKNVSNREARRYLLKDRWTRLNIHQVAEAATQKYPDTMELFEWYPYLSDHAHGSAGLTGDYLQKQGSQLFVKDHRDPRFKSGSMAVSALVLAHSVLVGLNDIGLKCDPESLIADLPFSGPEFDDL
ncbi:MAG: DUF5677 domain-containing protein [Coriobacteriia bacterium]|nr:DUF5677 domain-containing protein [Coriobacteriia bacterium]